VSTANTAASAVAGLEALLAVVTIVVGALVANSLVEANSNAQPSTKQPSIATPHAYTPPTLSLPTKASPQYKGTVYLIVRSKPLATLRRSTAARPARFASPAGWVSPTPKPLCTIRASWQDNTDVHYTAMPTGSITAYALHWGCNEAASARTCHVDIGARPKTVCVTTNLDDAQTRAVCRSYTR
jgi:hypothetical protein